MSLVRKTKIYIALLMRFLRRGLWETPTSRLLFVVTACTRRLLVAYKLFSREGMTYRAAALTYSTLLAVVPLLAVIFAIAKGFGFAEYAEDWVRNNIAGKPEAAETLADFVQNYLGHARGGVFLGFGLVLLVWTVFKLTHSVEGAFNSLWQVRQQRPPTRMFADYAAVFIMLPFFLLASSGLMGFLYSTANSAVPDFFILRPAVIFVIQIVPYLLSCLFFTILYVFMPNTRVRWRSALTAGIPIGIIFQVLQFFYIHSQVWLTSYNAIYGSFAALPLFMLMCQVSWTVILFGGALSYADQNLGSFYHGKDDVSMSHLDRDCLCVRLVGHICKRFAQAQAPMNLEQLAAAEQVHLRVVTDAMYELAKAGIVMKVDGSKKDEPDTYLPALDIHKLTAAKVLSALDRQGDDVMENRQDQWETFCRKRRNIFNDQFEDIPLFRLAEENIQHQQPNEEK